MKPGFWSSETMHRRLPSLIEPYEPQRIVNCSYEMSLGSQVVITGEASTIRQSLSSGEQIRIPPGQFAQLLTRERIQIPDDSLGLISVKSRFKLWGLINVSGFHVDPGFVGHLLFSVYNAGSQPIVISEGTPAFLLWCATLDMPTANPYEGSRRGLDSIPDDDVQRLQGDVFTPHALAERLAVLERHRLDSRVAELETVLRLKSERRAKNSNLIYGVAGAIIAAVLLGAGAWAWDQLGNDSPSDPLPSSTTSLTTTTTSP